MFEYEPTVSAILRRRVVEHSTKLLLHHSLKKRLKKKRHEILNVVIMISSKFEEKKFPLTFQLVSAYNAQRPRGVKIQGKNMHLESQRIWHPWVPLISGM